MCNSHCIINLRECIIIYSVGTGSEGKSLIIVVLKLYRFELASASFLEKPRINFSGRFRADVSTLNNGPTNYEKVMEGEEIVVKKFNPGGTNTFTMIDCRVTSVVLENGLAIEDEIIGELIVINPESSLPKLITLDPDQQDTSSIYGMKLGVNWSMLSNNAFIGDFVLAMLERDSWFRQANSTDPDKYCVDKKIQCLAAHSVSKLVNVQWSKQLTSNALRSLKEHTHKDKEDGYTLSIMLTLYNYNRMPEEPWFLYGSIVGSIGISSAGESLSFPENRVMKAINNIPVPVPSWSPLCALISNFTTTTYFDVFGSTLAIDFSNSIPIDTNGELCHLYRLFVCILVDDQVTVELVGELPYMEKDWYKMTSGIQDFELTDQQLKFVQKRKVIAVFFKAKPVENTLKQGDRYPVCDNNTLSTSNCVYIILSEDPYLVAPMDHTNYRLEKGDSAEARLKVRHYGVQPSEKLSLSLCDVSPNGDATNSDLKYTRTQTTGKDGIAIFYFVAGDVGTPRKYIDGQVFIFNYCVCEQCEKMNCQQCSVNVGNTLSFLVWSHMKYKRPYFWDTHVKPIFFQYQKLYPVMNSILKLGDYEAVTKPRNIDMILFTMSMDINHPSYMPASRDLSPTKKEMIIEWLRTEDHPLNWDTLIEKEYEIPSFCNRSYLFYREKLRKELVTEKSLSWIKNFPKNEYVAILLDGLGEDSLPTLAESEIAQSFSKVSTVIEQSHTQTLKEWKNDLFIRRTIDVLKNRDHLTDSYIEALLSMVLKLSNDDSNSLPSWYTSSHCSKRQLKENLQIALQLEFSTIPPYLTALYSIKDGYNQEAYEIIRSVVMQEMLHMAQAANLLIAIGGRPIIDSAQVAPSYPGKIPGGVLPGLNVTLQKASPKYIADVFMMIEFPNELVYEDSFSNKEKEIKSHVLTIGKFYKNIQQCMIELYEKEGENFFDKEAKQMTWPWTAHEDGIKLVTVSSIEEAIDAINVIIEEGEGTEQKDPTYLKSSDLAHFFKFEMLACKHHLRILHDHEQYFYDLRGAEIEFTPEGIWPMQDNPSSKNIPKNSHLYHEAKIFHDVYRSLLRSLQAAFNGQPDAIKESVPLMSSMQIQAKKLMAMEMPSSLPGQPKQTCGPIFDYDWQI